MPEFGADVLRDEQLVGLERQVVHTKLLLYKIKSTPRVVDSKELAQRIRCKYVIDHVVGAKRAAALIFKSNSHFVFFAINSFGILAAVASELVSDKVYFLRLRNLAQSQLNLFASSKRLVVRSVAVWSLLSVFGLVAWFVFQSWTQLLSFLIPSPLVNLRGLDLKFLSNCIDLGFVPVLGAIELLGEVRYLILIKALHVCRDEKNNKL